MKFATWNMLSSGLADEEFMTPEGDKEATAWAKRGPRILAVVCELLADNDLLALQEVDVFFWMLHQIRKNRPEIHGAWVIPSAYETSIDPKNESFLLNSSAAAGRTFASERAPPEFALNRLKARREKLPSRCENAPYHSPHGIALLWNSNKLAMSNSLSSVSWLSWGASGYMAYGFAPQRHLVVRFRVLSTNQDLMVGAAHLKSGKRHGPQRAAHLEQILDVFDQHAFMGRRRDTVLLMDANYDSCADCDSLLLDKGFCQVCPLRETPSFKMRSARSPQKDKAGLLKATCVDKVLIPKSSALHWSPVAAISSSSFRIPTSEQISLLRTLAHQANPILPELAKLEHWCNSVREGCASSPKALEAIARSVGPLFQRTVHASEIQSALMCLQPNTKAPSDHIPISVEWSSA